MKFLTVLLSLSLLISSCSGSKSDSDKPISDTPSTEQSTDNTQAKKSMEDVVVIKRTEDTTADLAKALKAFFKASNENDANKIASLMYPKLYEAGVKREDLMAFFYNQFKLMKTFQLSNIEIEDENFVLENGTADDFYAKKYTADVLIELDPSMAKDFDIFAQQTTAVDPNAKIDAEQLKVEFKDKKKLILAQDDKGTYVIPENFLVGMNVEGLDVQKLLEDYYSIP